jgi:hypothetical protein
MAFIFKNSYFGQLVDFRPTLGKALWFRALPKWGLRLVATLQRPFFS